MKRRLLALCLSVVMLLGVTACQKNNSDEQKSQGDGNVVQSVGILDGSACSIRKYVVADVQASELFGMSDGWATVYGSYKGDDGMFFVNAKGEVLGNHVYDFAYSFTSGTAYVDENGQWYEIDTDGTVIDELGEENPYSHTSGPKPVLTEVDGEERWYITDLGEAITEPIFSWISGVAYGENHYAILADAEHPNVLINDDGEVTAVLPDDCTHATEGENSIVATYEDAEGNPCYGLLDIHGKALSEHRYQALTEVERWLAVGITDGRVMLLDEFGKPLVELDVTVNELAGKTTVEFDGDVIAVVDENNQLVMLQLVFDEIPVRRRALELVEKAEELFYFYLSGYTDYDVDYANPTQGVDWLHEGTVATYLGKSIELTGDYKRFEGEVMGQKVDSLASLRKAVETVLTPEAAGKRYFSPEDTFPYFVEYEGKLFRVAGDGGYLPALDRGSVKILSQSDTAVEFTIDDYYHYKGDGDTYRFEMVKTEDGWRLDTAFPGEEIEE